jgi:hypothetical protein
MNKTKSKVGLAILTVYLLMVFAALIFAVINLTKSAFCGLYLCNSDYPLEFCIHCYSRPIENSRFCPDIFEIYCSSFVCSYQCKPYVLYNASTETKWQMKKLRGQQRNEGGEVQEKLRRMYA